VLSAPVTPYNSIGTYKTGDLVLDVTGIVFEAVQNNTGGPLTNTANWLAADKDAYVTANDTRHVQKNPAQQAADLKDLTHFIPAADYAELLNATDICGVINIVNDSTLPSGFNLLTNGKVPVPPAQTLFTINFLNRAAKWKYILLPSSTGTIKQLAPPTGTLAFDGTVTANTATSAFPLRFNDVQNTYKFQLTTGAGPMIISPLPLASPEIIKQDTITNSLYSEIYLNY
jgi:hypothetical protein